MPSYELLGAEKTWEELYRENLKKFGIPYEAAPIENGTITIKDTSVKDAVIETAKGTLDAAIKGALIPVEAAKQVIAVPIRIGGVVVGTVEKTIGAVGTAVTGVAETAKALPIVLVILGLGVGGYLIFAGRKGTKLTPF